MTFDEGLEGTVLAGMGGGRQPQKKDGKGCDI